MESAEQARDWLCNPESQVSAHYVIARDGTIWHLVKEEMRAWHAGAGAWGTVADVNSRSIGIEIANTGSEPFAEPQMRAVETVLAAILKRWAIPPERVIGHSDMAPGRKIDPGCRFDWRRLALQGLSVWPEGTVSSSPNGLSSTATSVAQDLRNFGYAADIPEETRLAAFRLRFRPEAEGPVDQYDAMIAHDLSKRFPVDQRSLTS